MLTHWERMKRAKPEHDACGIVSSIEKNGFPTHENVLCILDALILMSHRAGFVDGEGDGCGILMDIPRKLWSKKLTRHGVPGSVAEEPGFVVGHFFLAHAERGQANEVIPKLADYFTASGLTILLESHDAVDSTVLGPLAKQDEPLFIQLAIKAPNMDDAQIGKLLFELQWKIESELPIHVVSLSSFSVVYKVRGSANILPHYYLDLMSKDCRSVAAIGHNRYSTNTSTIFERVQPFGLLGHNGEINTIQKLREEAEMVGIPLIPGASDSQDLNRLLEGMIHRFGYSLFEAMEMAFPPILNEIKNFSSELQDLYMFYRSLWGPYAQGPAGIVSRFGNMCVFSVDALGLRPLWVVETDERLLFSSEQGVVPLCEMVHDPKPLSPGEKIGVVLQEGHIVVYPYEQLQAHVLESAKQKHRFQNFRRSIKFGTPGLDQIDSYHSVTLQADSAELEKLQSAFGWDSTDLEMIEFQASTGAEPIRSLGYDGPLAALSKDRVNLSDFFKETVAVVTNPAIDREREIEHFSTRVVLGPRPSFHAMERSKTCRIELQTPLLLGGHQKGTPLSTDVYRPMAHELGTYLFEDLLHEFVTSPTSAASLDLAQYEEESILESVTRLQKQAVAAVMDGAQLLVLDDRFCFRPEMRWLDPALAVSAVHFALKEHSVKTSADNLRRRASIVVRSGAIRNLHDIMVIIGLGADAVCPYLMWETAANIEPQMTLKNLYGALQKGLEKVISTLGIHEVRGYDRLFSSIGLKPELVRFLGTVNFFGSEKAGHGFAEMEADTQERSQIAAGKQSAKLAKPYLYYPRIWKYAGDVAAGTKTFDLFAEKLSEMETENPISIRHLLDIKNMEDRLPIAPEEVSIGVGDHSLPFVISSMSFGSQNETAYRAYAEAAYQLDMISMNGEGGEIKDLIGKYPLHRGMQIASGRFGVNIELTNSTQLLEIKIGQGAKPGEGGHLPGSKVSAKVAAARNAQPGTDLISPSNNHDIYSIEDLAQMIDELKTANPLAKVSVKVPVVPNIGTIAVGIAKAGADIVVLSGFDGGTGAARRHALKYVGLPVEIGVKLAHRELVEAGLREKVEIWGDGGIKTGTDVLKLILLGANRVGFGTMAMVALGCTACHGCHKDTCHVGIATQIDTTEEAKEKGLKLFKPREFESGVEALIKFFTAVGDQLRALVSQLGVREAQELVGRSDLLSQVAGITQLDLKELIEPDRLSRSFAGRKLSVRESSIGSKSLSERLAEETVMEAAAGADTVIRQVERAQAPDRVLGSFLAGTVTRRKFEGDLHTFQKANVLFDEGSIAGNGFAAYNSTGLHLRLQGGAQDGVGKGAYGGKAIILKGKNKLGQYINGSVGKGFAYGAQRGLFMIQGDADSRAGIRLSGADLVFGGELKEPVHDSLGMIASRANLKGFAFEYMTNGRAIVLGDPGPWICSGMTGGVVYLRVQPEMGLTELALRKRIAKGAKVSLQKLDPSGKRDLEELIGAYHRELIRSGQTETAERVKSLLAHPEHHFMMVKPGILQTDQDIATE